MKKMNRKGFVLAEAIVVAVFVLGMFTYLAINIIPLITKYDQALKYDNPQEVYAANLFFDELVAYHSKYTTDSIRWLLFPENISREVEFSDLITLTNIEYFDSLIQTIGISSVELVTVADECVSLKRGMKEYCNYIFNSKTIELQDSSVVDASTHTTIHFFEKIFLIEFNNGNYSNFIALVEDN